MNKAISLISDGYGQGSINESYSQHGFKELFVSISMFSDCKLMISGKKILKFSQYKLTKVFFNCEFIS